MVGGSVVVRGAGLSGLSAAVNLKLRGLDVVVCERNPSVGLQIKGNYQVLRCSNVGEYLGLLNLKPAFEHLTFSRAILSTRRRDIRISLREPIFFVRRGGVDSLEGGLYRQALGLGVEFKFGSQGDRVDIVASGPRRVDGVTYGLVFEGSSFPRDRFLMMYDDRYSPKGWYLYAVPYGRDEVKIVNCVSKPYCSRAEKLLHRAIEERSILREYFGGLKPVDSFGGYGNCWIPRTAVVDGVLYTGEAAGFQDPFRGFGMNFALESGFLAARALAEGLDYDALWRERFMQNLEFDYARRFFMSVFGDRLVDLMYRNVKDDDTIKFKSGDVGGMPGAVLKKVFCGMEQLKRGVTGCW